MNITTIEPWVSTLGYVAMAIIAVVFGVQKLMKGWLETGTESSVISMMHTELTRMSSQNQLLTMELSKLQIELVALNKDLRLLTSENQKLHMDVAALASEVNSLNILLKNRDMTV